MRFIILKEKIIFFSGIQFGTVITLPVSGWLCDTTFLGGWPSVFYIFGFLGVIWGIAWFLLVKESPEDHPRISKWEYHHITSNLPPRKVNMIKKICSLNIFIN